MEGRDELRFEELRSDLHDLTDAITGLGIELEAINMSVRAATAHLIGEDPLRNSLYYGGPAEEGPAPEPPAWVNSGAESEAGERLATPAEREHLIREQNAGGGLGWAMVVAALTAVLTAAVVLFLLL